MYELGEDSDIYAGAIVHENCILGKRVVLRAKAVIGGEGFGLPQKMVFIRIFSSRQCYS